MRIPYTCMVATVFWVFFGVGLAEKSMALDPDDYLADPKLQAVAEGLYKKIRCVVCQSQSVADSHAPLAKSMRQVIKTRLEAGQSEEEVIAYLLSRYGDFILLRPPFTGIHISLWVVPLVLLVLFIGGGSVFLRPRQKTSGPSK